MRPLSVQLKLFLLFTVIFLVTFLIPKPSWLSCIPQEYGTSQISKTDTPKQRLHGLEVIDPQARSVFRMFHIYNETLSEIEERYRALKLTRRYLDENITQPVPRIKFLPSTLQRLPEHLHPRNRQPTNTLRQNSPGVTTRLPNIQMVNQISKKKQLKEKAGSNGAETRVERRRIPRQNFLDYPECVDFLGPLEMKSPKICIHPPEIDTHISVVLRKTGQWEVDRVTDMAYALLTYPDMQLVDLGCNVGVFTLYAAGMGRHVIAVDVLPDNLELLRTSLTLNDIENYGYVVSNSSGKMYSTRNLTKSKVKKKKKKKEPISNLNQDKQVKAQHVLSPESRSVITTIGRTRTQTKYAPETEFLSHYIGKLKRRVYTARTKKGKRKSKDLALLFGRKILQYAQYQDMAEKEMQTSTVRNNSKSGGKSYVRDSRDLKRNESRPTGGHRGIKDNDSRSIIHTKTLQISDLVTIVHNAVYSDRTSRLGIYYSPDGNIGGSQVVTQDSPLLKLQSGSKNITLVDTICLDDLLPYVHAPSVYLKMDIEGSEPRAFKCAEKFFEKIHVRYVFMEWLYQLRDIGKPNQQAPAMIRFLMGRGFIPTVGAGVDVKGGAADNRDVIVLDVNGWHRWPDMVLWQER